MDGDGVESAGGEPTGGPSSQADTHLHRWLRALRTYEWGVLAIGGLFAALVVALGVAALVGDAEPHWLIPLSVGFFTAWDLVFVGAFVPKVFTARVRLVEGQGHILDFTISLLLLALTFAIYQVAQSDSFTDQNEQRLMTGLLIAALTEWAQGVKHWLVDVGAREGRAAVR